MRICSIVRQLTSRRRGLATSTARHFARAAHLGVVGSDDKDVVPAEPPLTLVLVGVGDADEALELPPDRLGFLRRRAAVPLVLDGQPAETVAGGDVPEGRA